MSEQARHCSFGLTKTFCVAAQFSFQYGKGKFNPNRLLDRLPVILGCFHRFLFIFRLLVGILPVFFS
jgi:hypothetical protein